MGSGVISEAAYLRKRTPGAMGRSLQHKKRSEEKVIKSQFKKTCTEYPLCVKCYSKCEDRQ